MAPTKPTETFSKPGFDGSVGALSKNAPLCCGKESRRLPRTAVCCYPRNSFSSSFRCRSTSSTNNFDTEGRPPYFLARSNATRFNSSHISAGRLMPVVRCVRSSIGVRGFEFGAGRLGIVRVEFSSIRNCQFARFWCRLRSCTVGHYVLRSVNCQFTSNLR